jgi:uncharacterized membrane protein YgaE (UPF0421/DUF939 family)
MGKRFGIGALAVAALIAAGPASAQLSAKPAVGTVIGVKSATMLAFQNGYERFGLGVSSDIVPFLITGTIVSVVTYTVAQDSSDPASP